MADSDFIPDNQFVPDEAPVAAAQPSPAGGVPGPDFIPDSQFVPDSEKYGTPGQQLLTIAEKGAKGFLGPLATLAERKLSESGIPGLSPHEQAGREAANPAEATAAEIAGFGAGVFTGTGEAAALEHAGQAAAKAAQFAGIGGPGAGVLAKIGSGAVRGAVENGLFQSLDETSKMINADPNESVQAAIPNVGLAALIGGTLGGGAGAVSSLWRATLGTKTGALLHSVSERVGGIEGVEANPVGDLVSKTGMDVPAEVQAGLKNDLAVREMFDTLNQSDTTNSGREFQETKKQFTQKAGEVLSESLGRDPGKIPDDFDKFTHGKTIGETLADEVDARIAPLKEAYEGHAEKFAGKELEQSIANKESAQKIKEATDQLHEATNELKSAQKSGNYMEAPALAAKIDAAQAALDEVQKSASVPGTADVLSDKLGKLAENERWTVTPDDDIMKGVRQIQKDLAGPNIKTLSDLTAIIKSVDDKMPFDPFKGARNRAAGLIKKELRDAESELIAKHIGSEQGDVALSEYRQTQKTYGAESKLKEELQGRLGKLGSTASYGDKIREMAKTDGEAVFRKLSGKDDADLLRLLQENFPKTAEALRQAHLDQILTKAKVGDGILPNKILAGIDKLSPQLKGFVIPAQSAERVAAIGQMLEKLEGTKHNFSNTARTMDKLLQYIPGSAVGLVSMLLSHNPAMGLMIGGLTKYISKDAPDAIRLGLLKWLGSNKPIEAGAFKSMVDFIHNSSQGSDLISKSARAIFSGANKVIPDRFMPSPSDISNLDKKLKDVQENPTSLETVSTNLSHYMPDHGVAAVSTATNAAMALNGLRPSQVKNAPLDPDIEPSDAEKEKFHRTLSIAQQPLMLLHHLNENTLTSDDVNVAKALYPAFYSKLAEKMTDAMTNHVSKGNTVPYETRVGLSILLGQPMDSSMSPQSIASNQAIMAVANQQSQAGAAPMKPSSAQKGIREAKFANRISLSGSEENV